MIIHDVYPYTEAPLPEFETMHQLPTREERADFVMVVLETLARNPSYRIGDETEKVSLWLPEGIIYVARHYSGGIGSGDVEALGVELSIFKEVGNPAADSKEVEVYQAFQSRGRQYGGMPVLWDWGVNVAGVEGSAGQAFADMVELRADQPPSHLAVQPKTLTENLGLAAVQAHIMDIVGEISGDELRAISANIEHMEGESTACSQRTLVAITQLLRDLLTHD